MTPVFFLLSGPDYLRLISHRPGYAWSVWVAIISWFFLFGCYFVLWRSIKRVSVDGDYFLISNYVRTHRAPLNSLSAIAIEKRGGIVLHFEPPTPFGSSVRIIPPIEPFDDTLAQEAASYLKSIINQRELGVLSS
jgi:hypothetical protein